MNNNQIYIGRTNDLNRRLEEHKLGDVFTTKKYLPVKLVYYEAYLSEKDTERRESALKKYGSSWSHIKRRIFSSLKDVQERG